jgi:hypothetical protein
MKFKPFPRIQKIKKFMYKAFHYKGSLVMKRGNNEFNPLVNTKYMDGDSYKDVDEFKKKVEESLEFSISVNFDSLRDDDAMVGIDLKQVEPYSEDNSLLHIGFSIMANTVTDEENVAEDCLKYLTYDIMYYFENLGFNLYGTAFAYHCWEHSSKSSDPDFIESFPDKPTVQFAEDNPHNKIDYVLYRDDEAFCIDDDIDNFSAFRAEVYGDDEDDNTLRPRTNDEILGDILGGDDDEDE